MEIFELINAQNWREIENVIEVKDCSELDAAAVLSMLISMSCPSYLSELALKKGVNPNIADVKNRTPIFYYHTDKNGYEIINYLISNNANLNHLNYSQENFLMFKYDENILGLLEGTDFNFYQWNEDGKNLFHIIALSGVVKLENHNVFKNLDTSKLDVPNEKGLTPLHLSLIAFRPKIAKQYLKMGFNPLVKTECECNLIDVAIPSGLNCYEIIEHYSNNIESFIDRDYYSEQEAEARKAEYLADIYEMQKVFNVI